MDFHEPFQLAVPAGTALTTNPDGERTRPAREGPAARPRQLVGHVHHRLHDPDRAVRRPVHVPASARARSSRRRSSAPSASWPPRSPGNWIPGSPLERLLLAHARADDPGARRLRVRRLGAAGVAAALPARLPVELPQDRHDRAAGRRRDRRQPDAARRRRSTTLFADGGGPYFDGPHLPVRLHLHHVRGDLGFHALVSSGTTPKMIDKESDIR